MPQDIDRFEDEADSAVRTFPKGTIIFREGQTSDVAYVVKKGRVSIYRVVGNKRVRLGERGPGGVQQLPARPHSVMAGCVVDPHRVALLPAQSECGRRTRKLRVSV